LQSDLCSLPDRNGENFGLLEDLDISNTLQSDGKIIAGGFFTNIGRQSRTNLARLPNNI
jgi:hypothetical protein